MCTYAFRGATHLMAAEDAGLYMTVRGANRQWELPSCQAHYKLTPGDWPMLREAVREALTGGPRTRTELAHEVCANHRLRHLQDAFLDPSHTLLKPLAWQGELCFAPSRDEQPTYRSPSANPRWTGLIDLDHAGRQAVQNYLAGYGPATRDTVRHGLVAGLSGP